MDLLKIIGLKVVAIKGYRSPFAKKSFKYVGYIEPEFILFDDGETYIELVEQDYYSYHDCSSSARHMNILQDKDSWEDIYNNKDEKYPDSNVDL